MGFWFIIKFKIFLFMFFSFKNLYFFIIWLFRYWVIVVDIKIVFGFAVFFKWVVIFIDGLIVV